jgi:hypothetical protein
LVPVPKLPGAACAKPGVDPALFEEEYEWGGQALSPAGKRALRGEALALCGTCPERAACLAHALEWGERGVWGGMLEGERAAVLASRRAADVVERMAL